MQKEIWHHKAISQTVGASTFSETLLFLTFIQIEH